jgi:uncharacterized protein YaeQ
MALTATPYRVHIDLSDVDRSVYEQLDLRVARHPSESFRYMALRIIAYALCYQEGLAFSKGGLSNSDEPPLAVHDLTGRLLAFIDVGQPSAERLHRAAKLCDTVQVFTAIDWVLLRRELGNKPVHRADQILVTRLPPAMIDSWEAHFDRTTKLSITRNDGTLYVAVEGHSSECVLDCQPLLATG